MIRFTHKHIVATFLLLVFGCKGFSSSEKSCEHLVRNFQYQQYIGKSFGEFYRDFQKQADEKGIKTVCELYHPKPGMVGGTELILGDGYKIAVSNNSNYYVPNFSDTAAKCYACSCIQNDTAKITGIEIFKNQQSIRAYH